MESTEQYDCLLDLVTKRRNVRQFKPDPVPDEYITKIIEVARWAPSGFHTQPWEFVIINDREVKAKIVAALDEHGPAIKDPASACIWRQPPWDLPPSGTRPLRVPLPSALRRPGCACAGPSSGRLSGGRVPQ